MRVLAFAVTMVLLAAPSAAAQGTLRVRINPDASTVTSEAGTRTDVGLTIAVEFVGTTCQPGTETAVNLVLASMPAWAGASLRPAGARYEYPRESKRSTLEILADEENAEDGARVRYEIQPSVARPNATACAGSLSIDAPRAYINVTFQRPPTTSPSTSEAADGGGSPGLGTLGILLALVLGGWGRRRNR